MFNLLCRIVNVWNRLHNVVLSVPSISVSKQRLLDVEFNLNQLTLLSLFIVDFTVLPNNICDSFVLFE